MSGALRKRLGRALQTGLGRLGYRLAPVPRSTAPGPAREPVGELRPFLRGLAARGFSPRHVLDVGAHHGEWSRTARDFFPTAAFTLVEPQAEMRSDLERFCTETPGSRWIEAGAASESGVRPLVIFADRGSSSFLPDEDDAGGEETRRVEVVTLDSLFTGPGTPDPPELIKVDAEGYELEVLRGAESLLGLAQVVVLEAAFFTFRPGQPTFVDLVQFMEQRGFRPYDFAWFLRRPLDGALGLADVAFARRDGTLRHDRRWNS